MNNNWVYKATAPLDKAALECAKARQAVLTKPAGSLGRLESIAESFAAWQRQEKPICENILVRIFAGDHGVCAQGVSAFDQDVTAQMIFNFLQGGAAISVLSKQIGANFSVVNIGTASPIPDSEGLINAQLANGTQDFTHECAMTESVLFEALELGRQQIIENEYDLFVGGEMGIGNTTSASAIYSALLDLPPEITVGPGTGLKQQGIERKRQVIDRALNHHVDSLDCPLSTLRCIGGLEIAALVGAYVAAAQKGVPILVDGFITTAAALIACRLNENVIDWMLFAHQSAEPAHSKALHSLNAQPLLDLGMRLGEGSGAAVAVPLIQAALLLHNNMATFADAQVSEKQ